MIRAPDDADQPGFQSGLVATLGIAAKELPCGPKSIFAIDHSYKRDICKTVDRTSRIANKVIYDSFYYEFLIYGGL